MQARLHGSGKTEAVRRADEALKAFELTEFSDRPCRTYSGGQRRRVDIALGVIHSPKVLFLDEPTVGLDPASRGHVWTEIRRLRDEGMTVVVTTHYLDEADALCDRVSIVDHGGIVAEGTPETLKREISGDVVLIGLGVGEAERAAKALREQPGLPELHRLELRGEDGLRLYLDDGAAAVPHLLRALDGAGVTTGTVQLQRPSLDDVFLARTGRSIEQS